MCDSRGHGSATSENIISDFHQTWIEDTWLTSTLVFSLVNIKKNDPTKRFLLFHKDSRDGISVHLRYYLTLSFCSATEWKHAREWASGFFSGDVKCFSALESLPSNILSPPGAVFVTSLKYAIVLKKKKRSRRDSSVKTSVVSSLAPSSSAQTVFFVSDRQTSHRQLRPVTLTASCFGRHVGFWKIWRWYVSLCMSHWGMCASRWWYWVN